MVVSALYITDTKGKIIISRNYRGDVSTSAVDRFAKHILEDEEMTLTPVINDGSQSFVYIRYNNLYLLAITKRNSNAMAIFAFLYRLVAVFTEYFGVLEEDAIRANFVVVYELLDEMCDFGYPQHTDAAVLQEVVWVKERHKFQKDSNVNLAPLTNTVSWRPDGIKHAKNEIFLDVVERLNILISSSGHVLNSEILGSLQVKSYLSGTPELKLGLNDRIMSEQRGRASKGKLIDLEDTRFHQCVRLARFENDRTISFIPPDGIFELMSYRLSTQVRPLIWVEPTIEMHKGSRIEYIIKAKSTFKRKSTATNVEIIVPVPADADSPEFNTSMGSVNYVPKQSAFIWTIKQFRGSAEYFLRAHFGLPSVAAEDNIINKTPISVNFEIPYFSVSGIQVRYLKIIEKSGYQSLPWVRYITKNGKYHIRIAQQ